MSRPAESRAARDLFGSLDGPMSRTSESESEVWCTPTDRETPLDNVADMDHVVHSRSRDNPNTTNSCADMLHSRSQPDIRCIVFAKGSGLPTTCHNVLNNCCNLLDSSSHRHKKSCNVLDNNCPSPAGHCISPLSSYDMTDANCNTPVINGNIPVTSGNTPVTGRNALSSNQSTPGTTQNAPTINRKRPATSRNISTSRHGASPAIYREPAVITLDDTCDIPVIAILDNTNNNPGYSRGITDTAADVPRDNGNAVATNDDVINNNNVPNAVAETSNDSAIQQRATGNKYELICLSSDEESALSPAQRRWPRAKIWRAGLTNNKKSTGRSWFTSEQRRRMVNYLIQKEAICCAKGYNIWTKMLQDGILSHHTPQSLQEHFRKVILPRIEQFPGLTAEQLAEFSKIRPLQKHW